MRPGSNRAPISRLFAELMAGVVAADRGHSAAARMPLAAE